MQWLYRSAGYESCGAEQLVFNHATFCKEKASTDLRAKGRALYIFLNKHHLGHLDTTMDFDETDTRASTPYRRSDQFSALCRTVQKDGGYAIGA